MAKFESGVARYIIGECTVFNHFPVDFSGNAALCCEQCKYFKPYTQTCVLNGEKCEYPKKYCGSQCPMNFKEE